MPSEGVVVEPVRERRRTLVGEGGRLSRAGELFAGRKIDAASGVLLLDGLERIVHDLGTAADKKSPKIFLAQLGDLAKKKSMKIFEDLRMAGIAVEESLGRDALKSQLAVAQKSGAAIALILGQKEAIDRTIIVRELDSGIQETIPQEKLIEFLHRKLK